MNLYKAVINPDPICQNIKIIFVIVIPRNACKFELADHLYLPFLDQPHSDVIVFEIMYF